MYDCRDFKAYDGRDHVYAILGLYLKYSSHQQLPLALTPDYAKTPSEVFRDATRFGGEERRDLSILRDLQHESSDICRRTDQPIEWPTWIPKYRQSWDWQYSPNKLGSDFAADGDSNRVEYAPLSCQSDVILAVKGVIVDRIAQSSAPLIKATFSEPQAILDMVKSFGQMLLDCNPSCYPQEIDTMLALVLTAGTRYDKSHLHGGDAERQLCALGAYLDRGKFPPSIREPHSSESSLDHAEARLSRNFVQAAYNAGQNRRFLVADNRHPGLGPWTMKPGDNVAVFFGCYWSVILRFRPEPGDYEVRGVAYVHGIMIGEAVRLHEAQGKEDEAFYLH